MNRFDLEMDKGGLIFWITTIICGVGLYGLLWLLLAIGVVLGL